MTSLSRILLSMEEGVMNEWVTHWLRSCDYDPDLEDSVRAAVAHYVVDSLGPGGRETLTTGEPATVSAVCDVIGVVVSTHMAGHHIDLAEIARTAPRPPEVTQ